MSASSRRGSLVPIALDYLECLDALMTLPRTDGEPCYVCARPIAPDAKTIEFAVDEHDCLSDATHAIGNWKAHDTCFSPVQRIEAKRLYAARRKAVATQQSITKTIIRETIENSLFSTQPDQFVLIEPELIALRSKNI